MNMCPVGFFHLRPFAKSIKPELKQPVRFILFFGDKPDNIFIQTFWSLIHFNVGIEAVLIFGLRNLVEYIFGIFIHRIKSLVRNKPFRIKKDRLYWTI